MAVKQMPRCFQVQVFPSLLFIVLAPVLAIELGGTYETLVMLGNLALFAATLRWRCMRCGESGALLFPRLHACEPSRVRPDGSPPPEAVQAGAPASVLVTMLVLAVVVMCAYLVVAR